MVRSVSILLRGPVIFSGSKSNSRATSTCGRRMSKWSTSKSSDMLIFALNSARKPSKASVKPDSSIWRGSLMSRVSLPLMLNGTLGMFRLEILAPVLPDRAMS